VPAGQAEIHLTPCAKIRVHLYLSECFPAGQVHGYFDAVSPTINDLHRFDELRKWLVGLGFGDVKRTMPGRNHHVVATRVGA